MPLLDPTRGKKGFDMLKSNILSPSFPKHLPLGDDRKDLIKISLLTDLFKISGFGQLLSNAYGQAKGKLSSSLCPNLK